MKKIASVTATVVTLLAVTAAVPAEARGLRVNRAAGAAIAAAAVAAGVAASTYGYGPGYYAPAYVYDDPGYVTFAVPYAYRGWTP